MSDTEPEQSRFDDIDGTCQECGGSVDVKLSGTPHFCGEFCSKAYQRRTDEGRVL